MRRRATIAAMALAIELLVASILWAQEPARPTMMPVPRDGKPWRIERIADIPQPLRSAIDRTHCRLDESVLHQLPILIFRPGSSPVIAIVPCPGTPGHGRAFAFERDQGIEPKPILFPTLAAPSGFGTTGTPGILDWNSDTKILMATQGNDVGGTNEMRHTYRYDAGQANWFTLIRIETRKCCPGTADQTWISIWEAPAWPRLQL